MQATATAARSPRLVCVDDVWLETATATNPRRAYKLVARAKRVRAKVQADWNDAPRSPCPATCADCRSLDRPAHSWETTAGVLVLGRCDRQRWYDAWLVEAAARAEEAECTALVSLQERATACVRPAPMLRTDVAPDDLDELRPGLSQQEMWTRLTAVTDRLAYPAFARLREGRTYADTGSRDQAMFAMVDRLADRCPDATDANILELLRAGLARTGDGLERELGKARDKLCAARKRYLTRDAVLLGA